MQEIHDRVVREIVNHLNNEAFDIQINPGQEKNAGIGDNYPDVVMTEKGKIQLNFFLRLRLPKALIRTRQSTNGKNTLQK